jgi:hypothetical protein
VSNAVAIANTFVQRRARQPAVDGQMRIGRHERYSSADRDGACGLPLRSWVLAPRG